MSPDPHVVRHLFMPIKHCGAGACTGLVRSSPYPHCMYSNSCHRGTRVGAYTGSGRGRREARGGWMVARGAEREPMPIRGQSFCSFYPRFGTSSRAFWPLAITRRPSGKREICQLHKGVSNAGYRRRGLPGCTGHESCKRVGVERRHRTHAPSEDQPNTHHYEFCCTRHVPRTMSKPSDTEVDSDPK